MFAIITFRATGPIKTWSDMRGANVHNARTKPIEHAIAGAPEPEHLIGTGDLVVDVKRHLRAADIDPARLRRGGVIAYEAIMTASPDFFDAGDEAARAARLRSWTDAQVAFARKRWGDHRVASMVLHLDEKTPHIHLVVLPLELKADARRNDGEERFSLVGRMISGPGQFDQLQDDYAAAMAPFGLSRGIAGSGRKHEPVPVYLHRLAEKEREADELRVAMIRERDALAAERVELEREKAEMGRNQRFVINAVGEVKRRDIAAWKAKAEAERMAREIALERTEWQAEQDAAKAAIASHWATSEQFRSDLNAVRDRIVPIFTAAKEFKAAAAGINANDIAAAVRPAVLAARQMVAIDQVGQGAWARQHAVAAAGQAAGRC